MLPILFALLFVSASSWSSGSTDYLAEENESSALWNNLGQMPIILALLLHLVLSFSSSSFGFQQKVFLQIVWNLVCYRSPHEQQQQHSLSDGCLKVWSVKITKSTSPQELPWLLVQDWRKPGAIWDNRRDNLSTSVRYFSNRYVRLPGTFKKKNNLLT